MLRRVLIKSDDNKVTEGFAAIVSKRIGSEFAYLIERCDSQDAYWDLD